MAAIISNLTAAALLAHTLLGCCWHHSHACAQACPATLSGGHDDVHAEPAAGGCVGHAGPAHHGQSLPGKCNGPRCAMDTSVVSKSPSATPVQSLRGVVVATVPPGGPLLSRGSGLGGDDHATRTPSVLPHLLNRVLLL